MGGGRGLREGGGGAVGKFWGGGGDVFWCFDTPYPRFVVVLKDLEEVMLGFSTDIELCC